jgi:hypothetical protein
LDLDLDLDLGLDLDLDLDFWDQGGLLSGDRNFWKVFKQFLSARKSP